MGVLQTYNSMMNEWADDRVKKWFLMDDMIPILTIELSYLIIVKSIGPWFMTNKKPYNLKTVLRFYNLFQVAACIIITSGIILDGWVENFTLSCYPINYSNDPSAVRLAGWVWWTMILKLIELIETIFFVLRKKFNQVTNLHLYHHTSTFMLLWLATKYIAGGMATFPIILNNSVHVVMYLYYYLATFPKWQKRLGKWKNKITMMQMIQFTLVILYSLQAFRANCDVPNLAALMFIPNIILIFYMFYDFYTKNYSRKSKQK